LALEPKKKAKKVKELPPISSNLYDSKKISKVSKKVDYIPLKQRKLKKEQEEK